MPSTALQNFVRVLRNAPAPSISANCLRLFPTPAFLNPRYVSDGQSRRVTAARRFASLNGPALSDSYNGDKSERPKVQQDGLQRLLSSRRRSNPEAWEALLDQYLPSGLRRQQEAATSNTEEDSPLPITGVASVLAGARQAASIDLLSYLGAYRERWEATDWLVKAMLHRCPPHSVLQQRTVQLPSALWNTRESTLEEVTCDSIGPLRPKPHGRLSLDEFSGEPPGTGRMGTSEPRLVIAQLWQGLGCMILQAEDRTASNPNRGVIMSHVLRMLAHVHHSGILSDSIYNYESSDDRLVIRRPPTLYRLSMRIMTVLSDFAWKSHWIGEMETATTLGYELPPPRIQPQLPHVGAEVWLELILWALIEGGWVTEAAWLVGEMERRRPNPESQWSVISWEELSKVEKLQLSWTTALRKEIDRSRLNQATGIGIANRGDLQGIEMGPRTISCEVILAIMDGIVNTANVDGHVYGNTLGKVGHRLASCKSLLESRRSDLGPRQLDALILRAIESSAVDMTQQPDDLRGLLELPSIKAHHHHYKSQDSSLEHLSLDSSAAMLGLQHKSLDGLARQADLTGALRALRSIQDMINTKRDFFMQAVTYNISERLAPGSEKLDASINDDHFDTPFIPPEIPLYAVGAVLDLLIQSKNFEIGKSLMSNQNNKEGLLSPDMFSQGPLQPYLLRFAAAAADDHLLLRILEDLETPFPEPILHALLYCQVSLNKWDAVDGILRHFRDTDEMAWAVTDGMRIAAAIVALEGKDGRANRIQTSRAKSVLQRLILGEFNTAQDHAQVPDFGQVRRANQLGRILQNVAGSLSTISLGPKGLYGRSSYSVSISPEDFQILLDSVVMHQGAAAGMLLWKQWCFSPHPPSPSKTALAFSEDEGSEGVVQPTALLLRLILQPVVEDMEKGVEMSTNASTTRRSRNTKDDVAIDTSRTFTSSNQQQSLRVASLISRETLSIFDWGINMYRKLGFTEEEVSHEVPPCLRLMIDRS